MIDLRFTITNPWSPIWKILKSSHRQLFKTKVWELNIYRTNQILTLELEYTMRVSHAGLNFMFGLLGYTIQLSITDSRHWDYDTDSWRNI